MTALPTSATYSPLLIALHWLMAVAIVTMFGLGLFMVSLPLSPDKLRYYSWHKWLGVSIFLLAVLRLTRHLRWGIFYPFIGKPGWQHAAARWVHRLLYLLMFAVPLSGWLMSSAKGVPTVYFGLWQLPDLVEKNTELGNALLSLHVLLNCALASVVVIHIAAALKHQLIDRDEVLARMLPFLQRTGSER